MTGHLDATWAMMADEALDVLLAGREANARWIVGIDRLWLPGTRPWGPGCVAVRATRAVHVLTTNDVGVPATVPHDHCFALSWDPGRLYRRVGAIAGVADATRIGVDGTNPLARQLIPTIAPGAVVVDTTEALRVARQVKHGDEITAIERSARVARDAFVAAAHGAVGTRVADVAARFYRALRRAGVTTASIHPRVVVGGRWLDAGSRVPADRPAVLEAGTVVDGWDAHLARPLGESDTIPLDPAIATLRPGAMVGDLRAEDEIDLDGVGLGYERLADADRLAPGMVVSLRVGTGERWRRDTVAITADGARVLTA